MKQEYIKGKDGRPLLINFNILSVYTEKSRGHTISGGATNFIFYNSQY
jgi:hypothetical protein